MRNESKATVFMYGVISTIIQLILTTINDSSILNVLPVGGQNPKVKYFFCIILQTIDSLEKLISFYKQAN